MTDRVLIVTADAKLRGLLVPLLESADLETKPVGSIVEAAKTFTEDAPPYSLIVLDREQPKGQSAYVFLRQLKADKVATPVVVVAPGASAEDLLAGFRLGAIEVIRKPTRPSVVRAMLTRVLPKKEA